MGDNRRIWYDALLSGLDPNIDFAGFAEATIRTAELAYGEASDEVDAVRGGWTEVGVLTDAGS